MLGLFDHIPTELLDSYQNEYGLEIKPISGCKVIVLNFIMDKADVILKGSNLEEYDSARNLTDYFFNRPSANAVSKFPCLFVSENGLKNNGAYSLESKDYAKMLRILSHNASIDPLLMPLYDFFMSDSKSIFIEIERFFPADSKTKHILTFTIDGMHIGRSPEYMLVRTEAAANFFEDYYTLSKRKITGRDQVCSMCYRISSEVWGYVSVYNFYTSKTEFAPIAGGFHKDKAHLNYPVCPQCAAKLKKLKPIIDQYFNFKFCGFTYILIPEVVTTAQDTEAIDTIIDIMVSQFEGDAGKSLQIKTRIGSLTLGERKKLLETETKEIFDILAEMSNNAAYTMLFYSINNAEFKILITVENIFPSQFQAVFNAKDLAERHSIFKQLPGLIKGGISDLEFRFEIYKEFIPLNDRIYGDFSKSFLEIVRCVFLQKPVSYRFILRRILSIIQRKFANELYYEMSVRKAFLILKFMSYLGIISTNQSEISLEVHMNSKFAEFFEEHKDFFDTSAKQSVFMLGVLCQRLLNIQFSDKGSSPFRKRLNSLKLNKDIVRRIYTEVIEKLEQYGKNYYTELEHDIANLMVKGGLEKLSNDEISYFFVLGMTLHKVFKSEIKEEEN